MGIRRALPATVAAGVLLLWVPVNAGPAQADPVPAPYAGSGHADIATTDVSVLSPLLAGLLTDTGVTGARIGHAQTRVDSQQSPRTRAESANLQASILGGTVTPDQAAATAPANASYDQNLVNLAVPTLLSTKGLHGSGEANWAGDTACVTGNLASATTRLASATVGELSLPLSSIPGLSDLPLTLADLGAATTTTTTDLVPHGATNDVRTRTTADLATTDLLNGLVKVDVADPTLVARSDGTTGTTSYNDPVVSVTADTDNNGSDDLTIPDVRLDNGASLPVTVTLLDAGAAGTLTATVDLTVHDDSPTVSGASASVSVPSVVSIDVSVSSTGLLAGLLGSDVASASLALLPLSAAATAPTGGVECDLAPPVVSAPADGSWSFDHRPTITGTGVPGATVHVYVDGSPTAADVTANGSGDWTYTPSSPLSTGTHNVVATQTLDGLTSAQSNHPVFHLADRPHVTAPDAGSSSYELSPAIEGTGQPGARIEAVIDNTTVGTTTVDDNGDWKLVTTDKLSCGKHVVTGRQTVGTLQASAQDVAFRVLCVDLTGGGGGAQQTVTAYSAGSGTSAGSLPGTGAPAGLQWLALLGAAVTAAGVALTRRGLRV